MRKNYDLWEIKSLIGTEQSDVEILRQCAQFGALAPSTHNSQPWCCRIEHESLIVSPDLTKRLPYSDPVDRDLYISLGCFVTNVRAAAAEHGKGITSKVIEREAWFEIRLQLRAYEETDTIYRNVFDQITKRVSDKSQYKSEKISSNKIGQLEALRIEGNRCRLYICDDPKQIEQFAAQYTLSAGKIVAQNGFRLELSQWLRPNFTTAPDGMPGFVSNIPTIVSLIVPYVLPYIAKAALLQVEKDSQKLCSSPALGVIVSSEDEPESWIHAGELYEMTALLATQMSISMTPMAALIEEKAGRALLSKLQGDSPAQFFFRMGYSSVEAPRHTPRRAVVFD